MEAGGPTPKAGPAASGVAGACRQRYVEIDDCPIQNPAYSLAHAKRGPGLRRGLFWFQGPEPTVLDPVISMMQNTPPGCPAHTLPSRCGGLHRVRPHHPLFPRRIRQAKRPWRRRGAPLIDTGTSARYTDPRTAKTDPCSGRPDADFPPPGGRRRSAALGPPTAPRAPPGSGFGPSVPSSGLQGDAVAGLLALPAALALQHHCCRSASSSSVSSRSARGSSTVSG